MALPHGKGLKTAALCFTAHSTKQKLMRKAPIAYGYPGIPAFCAWDELLGLGNWLFAFGCDNSTIATGWQVKDFKQRYSSQCRQGRRKKLSSQTRIESGKTMNNSDLNELLDSVWADVLTLF